MSKGSAKAPRTDYKALWEKYQTWAQEDRDWYDKERGRTQAHLARSGMKQGTPEWDRSMQALDAQYAEKQQTLQEGITGKTLMGGAKVKTGKFIQPSLAPFLALSGNIDTGDSTSLDSGVRALTRRAETLGEMEDFYSKKFGNIDGFAGNGNKVNYQKSVGAKQTKERQGYAFSGMNAARNPWMKRAK